MLFLHLLILWSLSSVSGVALLRLLGLCVRTAGRRCCSLPLFCLCKHYMLILCKYALHLLYMNRKSDTQKWRSKRLEFGCFLLWVPANNSQDETQCVTRSCVILAVSEEQIISCSLEHILSDDKVTSHNHLHNLWHEYASNYVHQQQKIR